MAALSLSIDALKPMNRWDNSSIRPGPVGSVGDTLIGVKLKHSMPSLPLRWEPEFSKGNEPYHGANVTDGSFTSYLTMGGPAKTIDTNWGGRRERKISHGWVWSDIRATDRRMEPIVGDQPAYTWNNKVASVYKSMHTGDKFLPLPGGYDIAPGEIPRGGSYPRITDVIGGTVPPWKNPYDVVTQGPGFSNGSFSKNDRYSTRRIARERTIPGRRGADN